MSRRPWDNDPDTSNMKIKVKSYPDGSKYVQIEEWGDRLIYRINTYEDLWLLKQIDDVLQHNEYAVILTIPNLLDAQADRRFNPDEPHSLKLVCEFLNGLKSFFRIEIFHPHNAEVVEALIDNVIIIDNFEFIKDVLNELHLDFKEEGRFPGVEMNLENHLILMSSDAGGYKPLMKLADKLTWAGETFAASKSRTYSESEGTKLTQLIDRQDFGGKDILIVDDICVYGGTFKGLSKLLKERNCGKLYLAVSHMTVQNLGDDAVTNYFDKVYTTDSKFDKYWDKTDRSFSIRQNLKILNQWN